MAVRSGDVILKCRPYAYVLHEEEHKKRCHFCFTRSNELVTCSGCRLLNYCNSNCQDLDLTFHCLECQCLQNMAPDCPSIMTRLLLRLIIRMQTGDHHKMFEENKIFQRRFIDLMSHSDDLQNDGIFYNKTEMMRYAKNCVDLPSHEILMEIFGKVVTNSFMIPDEYLGKAGIGIYLSTSILNHSCAPNATVAFKGLEQIVYALSDIPQVGPDKVFISYIDMNCPSWQRRDRLRKCYYFYCQCHWCEDEAQYIDHIMTSALCPVSGCLGFTGISRDNSGFYKLFPCSVCDKKEFSFDYEKMVRKTWTYGLECCNKLEKLETNKDYESVLSLAEEVLQELDKSIIYESNLLYIRVREFAIGACTELGLWTKAAEYGEKVWPHKMKCLPNVSYAIGSLLVELGKFYLNDHNIPEARRVFLDAKNLIITSYGMNSDTYKELLNLFDECDEIETLLNSGIVTGDVTKNASMKQMLSCIKSKIGKVLPRRFRIHVSSLFSSQNSHIKMS